VLFLDIIYLWSAKIPNRWKKYVLATSMPISTYRDKKIFF